MLANLRNAYVDRDTNEISKSKEGETYKVYFFPLNFCPEATILNLLKNPQILQEGAFG